MNKKDIIMSKLLMQKCNFEHPKVSNKHKKLFDKYYKHKKSSNKFMLVVVKYLNGFGFVISAHFVRNQR